MPCQERLAGETEIVVSQQYNYNYFVTRVDQILYNGITLCCFSLLELARIPTDCSIFTEFFFFFFFFCA